MPAESGRQQHFMGMVHAYQMGELHSKDLPAGVRSKVAKTAKSISKKASKEFAQSVEEQSDIDFSVLSFKEYIVAESALITAFSELTDEELDVLAEKCSMEDEEPAESKRVAKTAAKRGGKEAEFEDEEESKKSKKPEWLLKAELKAEKKEGHLKEKWEHDYKTPESKKGMFDGWTIQELESELDKLKKSGPHKEGSPEFTKEKEVMFALRAKRGWKSDALKEKWEQEYKVPESKKGMFSGKTQAELESELSKLRKSGPHHKGSPEYTKEKEVIFALRSKHGWKGA